VPLLTLTRWGRRPPSALRYPVGVLLALAAQIARLPLDPPTLVPYITYIPFMGASAAYGGFWPGLLTTVLCFLESMYFATEPIGTFLVRDPWNWFGLGSLLSIGLVADLLFEQVRKASEVDAWARELAALLNQTNDAIFVWELESKRITFWGQGAQTLYGYSRREALGRPSQELLATQFPESLAACLTAIRLSSYWQGELVYTARDGRQIATESRMSLLQGDDDKFRVIEVARDIGERKRLEQIQAQLGRERELRQQTQTLESIIQNSPACIALLRGPDFTYESVNPAYQALIPIEPMVGRTVAQVWPDAAPLVIPLLNVVREAQTVYHATEVCIPIRSAPEQPVEGRYFDLSYIPLPGSSGDVRVLVAVVEVTRYKRAEERLRDVNRALESALAQKTALLKEVHHRVKNNLAVVSSLLSMKAYSVGAATEVREALEESQRRVLSIALIHEQLYGSENLDRINFVEYTQQLVEQLHSSFVSEPGRIAIRLDIIPIEMGVDRAMPCALILNELVSNGFKHAFPGNRRGEVLVSLRESSPGQLEFVVEDNGIGSPPGLAERNTKSLGLTIVRILSRQLEGLFEQQSVTGGGTRFVTRFPAKDAVIDKAVSAILK